MGLNLRKFIVGLAALAALLAVYVVYTRLGGSGPIALHRAPGPNAIDLIDVPDERSGRVGNATVGPIGPTRLVHTDANNRPDREFRFEELYHKEGGQWEASHPFMQLYLPGFTCSVAADKGRVQIETGFGQPEPNDASFSGNVVIHIAPSEPNDLREVFIYLDNVTFIASRSLFSTLDAVRFVSRSAQLVGRGMELLYDEPRGRLERFRIYELDSLRLRSDAFGSLADSSRIASRASQGTSAEGAPTEVADEKDAAPPASEGGTEAAPDPLQPTSYECVFWKDVHIVTPQQIVHAKEQLSITDILWASPRRPSAVRERSRAGAAPNEPSRLPYPGPDALDTTGSKSLAFDSLPESFFDIVVTCSRGLVVRPTQLGAGRAGAWVDATSPSDVNEADPNSGASLVAGDTRVEGRDPGGERRQIVAARRIDFNVSKVNTTLAGPVRVSFHLDPNAMGNARPDDRLIPVTVDAQNEVRFVSAANQVVLDGNCVVAMQKAEPNVTTEYRLTAPRLTLDLIEDANAGSDAVSARLRHVSASGVASAQRGSAPAEPGGPVALLVARRSSLVAGDSSDERELLGWVELQAMQLDYRTQDTNFVATGPGRISLYNSQAASSGIDPNEFSLRQPCYAFLSHFSRLTYSALTRRIVAESKSRQLQIDYFPLITGPSGLAPVQRDSRLGESRGVAGVAPAKPGRHVAADVGRIEVELGEAADRRMELVSLAASDGVTYDDGANLFAGANLFYDHRKALMTIGADQTMPCYFNGALVGGIEMDVKTRRAKAQIQAPSTLQVK